MLISCTSIVIEIQKDKTQSVLVENVKLGDQILGLDENKNETMFFVRLRNVMAGSLIVLSAPIRV